MARRRIGAFEVDVAACDPVDLDLAIPRVAQPLTQIMRNYPLSWERAFNGPYFYPAPKPEEIVTDGILWDGGRMWSWSDRARPCLLVARDGRARIVDRPPRAAVEASRIAFGAGPDLFAVSLRDEMRRGEYSGFTIEQRTAQAAIGIRKDGKIVHAACLAITMPELAGVMADLGCVQAMRLDGGSSMGVLERGGRAFGNVGRALTVAVVMRRVEADAEGGPVVCLDPGHGGRDRANRGPTGYVEADGALDMALAAGMVLRSHGFEVVFTRDSDRDLAGPKYTQSGDLGGRVYAANRSGAGAFVSVHTNAGGGRGTETFCFPGSARGRRLAECVQRAVVGELGLADRGVKEANYYVLRATKMPACLVEVAFHDNALEEQLLKQPAFRARAGLAIAAGIMAYFKEG